MRLYLLAGSSNCLPSPLENENIKQIICQVYILVFVWIKQMRYNVALNEPSAGASLMSTKSEWYSCLVAKKANKCIF